MAPAGSTSWLTSVFPVVASSPTSSCAGLPLTSSSATTKISDRVPSITGVPVMPTVGEMSPQGSDPAGTGVPTWFDHSTAPVVADSAYTVSFSVATNTCPSHTSGSP